MWGCWPGDITSVDARLLRTLVDDGYIPVVASVAADISGQALNVNADIAAGEACPFIPSLPQNCPVSVSDFSPSPESSLARSIGPLRVYSKSAPAFTVVEARQSHWPCL